VGDDSGKHDLLTLVSKLYLTQVSKLEMP